MTTVQTVYDFIQTKAPFELQMDFDNAGFLVGRADRPVTRILVSLDITREVVEEAVKMGAQLIVAHHPVIWGGAKSVTDQTETGRILLAMIENGISAICAHTNLDAAVGGVNDALAHKLGLSDIQQLHQDGTDCNGNPYGIGRVGYVSEQPLSAFAAFVKEQLGAGGVRLVDGGKPVRKVAVGGGACYDMIHDALDKGCDTFVTSDVKYNGFLDAKAMGMNLLDAGHYPTENVISPVLKTWIEEAFPHLTVETSEYHSEVFSCI